MNYHFIGAMHAFIMGLQTTGKSVRGYLVVVCFAQFHSLLELY